MSISLVDYSDDESQTCALMSYEEIEEINLNVPDSLQLKVEAWTRAKKEGAHFNYKLMTSNSFFNPLLFEETVKNENINEHGSNFEYNGISRIKCYSS